MTGAKMSPRPPSASRSHAAISWKFDPDGTSAEYAGSRVSPASCVRALVVMRPPGGTRSPSSNGGREVRSVPLHRQVGQRPISVHILDDLAHRIDEARVVHRVFLVERDRERLVIERVPDQLDRTAIVVVRLD